MTNGINRRYGIMTVAIIMAFISLLTGTKGSPYTVFWIYAAYLSYKGDIKTLKSYLVILIWINAIIAAGVILFVDSKNLQWILPGSESHIIFFIAVGIPLAVKVAILLRINSLLNIETAETKESEVKITNNFPTQSISQPQRVASKKIPESMEDAYGRISQAMTPNTQPQNNNKIDEIKKATTNTEVNSQNIQPSITDWEMALSEYNGDGRNNGLWAKIFADNNGDENLTKAQYLKTRANQILQQRVIDENSKRENTYGSASNSTCIENEALNRHQSTFKFPIYRLANGNYAIYHNWKYKIYSTLESLNNAIDTYERTELFPKEGLIEEYVKK